MKIPSGFSLCLSGYPKKICCTFSCTQWTSQDNFYCKFWDNGIESGEFEYQAESWQKPRRITAIRQLVEEWPQAGGKYLFDMHDYRYQAWGTNLGLPAPEVWQLYRQRADSENRIEWVYARQPELLPVMGQHLRRSDCGKSARSVR